MKEIIDIYMKEIIGPQTFIALVLMYPAEAIIPTPWKTTFITS